MSLESVAAEAARKLKVTDDEVTPYATAAFAYVVADTGIPTLPENDAQLDIGLVLLTMRIFQDSPQPSGLGGFETFDAGTFTPRILAQHLDQYWIHLSTYDVDGVATVPANFRGIA